MKGPCVFTPLLDGSTGAGQQDTVCTCTGGLHYAHEIRPTWVHSGTIDTVSGRLPRILKTKSLLFFPIAISESPPAETKQPSRGMSRAADEDLGGRRTWSEDPLEQQSCRDRTGHAARSSQKEPTIEIDVLQLNESDFNSFLETISLPGMESKEATKDPLHSVNIDQSGDFLEHLITPETEAIASMSTKLQEATEQWKDSTLDQPSEMESGREPGTSGGQNHQTTHAYYITSNQKQTDHQTARSRNAKRQLRYRMRKKQEEKRIQEEMKRAKETIASLRAENTKLKSKRSTLISMLKRRESFSVLRDEIPGEGQRPEKKVTESGLDKSAGIDVHNLLPQIDLNLYIVYADVLSSLQNIEKDGDVSLAAMVDTFSNILETVPSTSMYQQFYGQLENIMAKYDACTCDDGKQGLLNEMEKLFSKRIHVVAEMAQKEPDLVISQLTDGWVGDILYQNTLPVSTGRTSQSATLALLQHLQLSQSQMSSLYSHWKILRAFCNESARAFWHRLKQSCSSQGMNDIENHASGSSPDTMIDVLESRGIRGLMCQKISLYVLSHTTDTILKNRVVMLLGLAQNIYTVLTPLQKARLCMNQPAAAPWCIYVPLMLADLSLDMDTWILVGNKPSIPSSQ